MRKIRIDFCDFWPEFCKTDNYFWNLLKTRFNVELHSQPDFIFYSNPANHVHRVHNCVKIYFGVEPYWPDWRECDYALTCHCLDNPRHLRLPFYLLYGSAQQLVKTIEEDVRQLVKREKFCSFVVSNAGKKAQKRVQFFHRLSCYKKVDSGGRHLNNIGSPVTGGPAGKLDFLRSYKFNIAFENTSLPGYTTEKLVEAMHARTVPIYWGNPRISEEFNPRSFLSYFDFSSEEALIERIIELDRDDEAYLEILRQPFFVNNRPNEWFEPEGFLTFFDRVFNETVIPVSRRRRFFQLGRWTLVKRNRPR